MAFQGVLPYGATAKNPAPAGKFGVPNPYGMGGQTNAKATAGAKAFKDTLGLPDYEDLLGKLGGGTREFGNSGLAATGAGEMRDQLGKTRGDLATQRANIERVRGDIRNPTGTEGFKNVMRLTNERGAIAAENSRRQASEAASRRGYVGGYSGEQDDMERKQTAAVAGYEAAGQEREAQQKLFGGETDLYGNMLGGYGQELGAYSDLTKTAAELPTKWLDAYSGLLGGLGNFGDIYGTAMKGVMFDEGNRREDDARNRKVVTDARDRIRQPGHSGFA